MDSPSPTAVDLATHIRAAREHRHLSRQALARLACTTIPTITAWEEGRGSRLRHLVAILTVLRLKLVVRARQ